MNNPPLVDVVELATRLGLDLTSDVLPRLAAIIDDASALVRAEAQQTWVDEYGDLEDVPDAVATVTLAVARRVYENKLGVTSETTGPFTIRYSDQAGEGLYLTEQEKELLARYRPSPSPGVWTLPTTRTEVEGASTIRQFDAADDVDAELGPIPTREPW